MASAKKLINLPEDAVEEMVQGILLSHPGLRRLEKHHVLVRHDYEAVKARQVAIVSGGGSGHEPAHAGFIGEGMLTAAVCGGVFASPSIQAVLDTIRTVTGPAGCLLIVKNYTGDRLNFGVAAEQAKAEGLLVEMAIVGDDVAVNAGEEVSNVITGRRGLSGTLFVHKVAGAAAASGSSLGTVFAEAVATAEAVDSMGVALNTCTVPGGQSSDRIGDGECEIGLGIHGEPGRSKQPLATADETVGQLMQRILKVRKTVEGDGPDAKPSVALMANNLGGSSVMELHIAARAAHHYLATQGFQVTRTFTGSLMTSLEMPGLILSVLTLDGLRSARLDAPTTAPAWPRSVAEPASPASLSLTIQVPSPPKAETSGTILEVSPAVAATAVAKAQAACEALVAAEERLSELDRIVGDGDCGQTFRRAAEAILAALPSMPSSEPDRFCRAIGSVVRDVMGGSSGAIMDIMLFAAAASLREAPGDWAAAMASGVQSAIFYGGAKPGSRTMIDALSPAAVAACGGASLADIAEAAEAGAQATKTLRALAGRSSYLTADATQGHPDPGAVAIGIALRAMAGDQ